MPSISIIVATSTRISISRWSQVCSDRNDLSAMQTADADTVLRVDCVTAEGGDSYAGSCSYHIDTGNADRQTLFLRLITDAIASSRMSNTARGKMMSKAKKERDRARQTTVVAESKDTARMLE